MFFKFYINTYVIPNVLTINKSIISRLDATEDENSLGRFVNDSYYFANFKMMKLGFFHNLSYVCLFATRDILTDEEILYDYGDDTVEWRKKVRMLFELTFL